jgi:hypothetical protein
MLAALSFAACGAVKDQVLTDQNRDDILKKVVQSSLRETT